MATIRERKNKKQSSFQILFYLNGRRREIPLGCRYTRRQVDEIKRQVEKIAAMIETGETVNKKMTVWLEEMPIDLRKRFEHAGLIEVDDTVTLERLWDEFLDYSESIGKKGGTLTHLELAEKWSFEYFTKSIDILEITESDAEQFKAWLLKQPKKSGKGILSPQTVAGYIAKIKSLFRFGLKKRYYTINPFEFVKKGTYRNKSRQFFIPIEYYPRLLDACNGQEWRVLVSLARIGGLRVPSEAFELRWSDIDWGQNRFYIRSVKTERYEGHEGRLSPLWPELKKELESLWDLTEEGGSCYVLDNLRKSCGAGNPRETFKAIIKRAGLLPWPKLWTNCRASRDTELKRLGFSEDQRSAWLGHCETISRDHYQIAAELVKDEDYNKAVQTVTVKEEGSKNEIKRERVKVIAEKQPQNRPQ